MYQTSIQSDGLLSTSQNKTRTVEAVLCWCWLFFLIFLAPRQFRSFKEALIILSPIVIFGSAGVTWMQSYSWWHMLNVSLGLFIIVTLVSQLVTIDVFNGLNAIRQFHLKFLAIVFSLLFVLKNLQNRLFLMWGLAATILVSVLFGYYQYFAPEGWQLWNRAFANEWPSAISPFGYHKNLFASYFSFYVPVLVAFCFIWGRREGWTSPKALSLMFLFVILIPILILTKSRASQGATVAATIIVSLVLAIKFSYFRFLSAFLIFLGAVVLISSFTEPVQEALARWNYSGLRQGFMGRLNWIWKDVLDTWWKRPIFGVDMTGESYRVFTGRNIQEHSTYLFFLVRTGLAGFISFLILNAVLIVTALRQIYHSNDFVRVCLLTGFLMGYVFGVLGRGFTEKPPQVFDWAVFFSFFIVLLTKTSSDRN